MDNPGRWTCKMLRPECLTSSANFAYTVVPYCFRVTLALMEDMEYLDPQDPLDHLDR